MTVLVEFTDAQYKLLEDILKPENTTDIPYIFARTYAGELTREQVDTATELLGKFGLDEVGHALDENWSAGVTRKIAREALQVHFPCCNKTIPFSEVVWVHHIGQGFACCPTDGLGTEMWEIVDETRTEPQSHMSFCATRISGECTCGEFERQEETDGDNK